MVLGMKLIISSAIANIYRGKKLATQQGLLQTKGSEPQLLSQQQPFRAKEIAGGLRMDYRCPMAIPKGWWTWWFLPRLHHW
jgi:hypothetical protein